MDNKKTTIPFGAFDSELHYHEINIPDGCEATIKDGKIIIRKIESEDERIRKELITWLQNTEGQVLPIDRYNAALAWLEKQGTKEPKKTSIWNHWKDGICGNGEGKLIYLIKDGDDYSLSSSLAYECDYIELSALDELMLQEKQGEKKSVIWSEEDEKMYRGVMAVCDVFSTATSFYPKENEDVERLKNWLKSLKPHTPWKPTEAQMSQLKWIAHQNADNIIGKELMTLYQDLQKLIE